MMRRAHVILGALIAVVAMDRPARACVCVTGDEIALTQQADAVFFGWVVQVVRFGKTEHALIRVDEAVKGVREGEQVVVSYGVRESSCDPPPMQLGHAYDVFAERERGGRLRTWLCGGTRDVTRGVTITQPSPGCGRCTAGSSLALGDLTLASLCVAGLVARRRRRKPTDA